MNEQPEFDAREEHAEPQQQAVERPHGNGTPLSIGVSRHDQQSAAQEQRQPFLSQEEARASKQESAQAPEFPGLQRAAGFVRTALPLLQRVLPLLDGNFATVVGNLIAARTNAQAARSSKVDFAPIEDGLAELRSQQHSLRLEMTEQNLSLKAIEDQLAMMRDATNRNMLEQQEAVEDLKAAAKRATVIAVFALLLAVGSLATTALLILQMKKMIP